MRPTPIVVGERCAGARMKDVECKILVGSSNRVRYSDFFSSTHRRERDHRRGGGHLLMVPNQTKLFNAVQGKRIFSKTFFSKMSLISMHLLQKWFDFGE